MPHLSGTPTLVGLIGHPVAGNPTGTMIEAAFAAAGLDWRYVSMDVAQGGLEAAVAGLSALGFRGFNVTMPYKVAILPLLSRLTEAAELIGATNTVLRDGDGWVGENTDGKGFLAAVTEVLEPRGARVCLLGAGGAARAIAVELALAGAASIGIVNRDEGRGRSLAQLLTSRTATTATWRSWTGPLAIEAGVDLVVNATSIGFHDPDAAPDVDLRSAGQPLVADVVFDPPQTRLLRAAEAAGCRTLDGLGMLANQGAIAFRLWTGVEPDVTLMRAVLAGA
ncbi:MAG TPA: shikimate dehydrogenase [Candidatus Limnocylindrales bacterium]